MRSRLLFKMKFIGVDFGWSSGASGLCCLKRTGDRLDLVDVTALVAIDEILTWLDRQTAEQEPAIVAIDAPIVINNPTGMRLCDRLTHKHFGRYHAGCYPANLNSRFAKRTTGFSKSLSDRGFQQAATIRPKLTGRYQIEVFPHPATVNLFDLTKIIKYKKGKIAERRRELRRLQGYMTNILPRLTPSLAPASLQQIPEILETQTGKELKAIEDMLDSILCAYVAAYWWYWGTEKNLVLGDLDTGYIVIPLPTASVISSI